jgi:DNA repair ATPase RecN
MNDHQLDSGDDLALDALSQSQAGQLSAGDDDEVEASDKVAETITALQNVIERNVEQLDEITDQIKHYREQMRNIFDNDPVLGEAEEQAAVVVNQVKERKSKLKADPEFTKLGVEVSELTDRKNDIRQALSGHLVNYYQLTNSTSFDTSDGDQREFTVSASVKGRRKK